jgi:hypothetical protein
MCPHLFLTAAWIASKWMSQGVREENESNLNSTNVLFVSGKQNSGARTYEQLKSGTVRSRWKTARRSGS